MSDFIEIAPTFISYTCQDPNERTLQKYLKFYFLVLKPNKFYFVVPGYLSFFVFFELSLVFFCDVSETVNMDSLVIKPENTMTL